MKLRDKIKWWNTEIKEIFEAMVHLRKCGTTKKDINIARHEQIGLTHMRYAKVLEDE